MGTDQRGLVKRLRTRGLRIKSHSSIVRYENDRTQPPANVLAALAEMAEVSGHWLLTGEGPMERTDESEVQLRLEAVRHAVDAPIDVLSAERLNRGKIR